MRYLSLIHVQRANQLIKLKYFILGYTPNQRQADSQPVWEGGSILPDTKIRLPRHLEFQILVNRVNNCLYLVSKEARSH